MTPLFALLLLAAPQMAERAAVSRTATPVVKLTATGVFSDGTTRLFGVTADTDGDGVEEPMTLAVGCSGVSLSYAKITYGGITAADDWESPVVRVLAPRDAASGLATGKRQHQPIVFRKELDKRVLATTTYDLKSMTKARTAAPVATTIALSGVDPAMCTFH